MTDFREVRRALLFSGLGASAVAGSAALLPSSPLTPMPSHIPDGMLPSIADFGALGDSVHDDAPAVQRALRHHQGELVVVPFRPRGYRLAAPVTIPARTSLWMIGEAQQRVIRAHDGDLFVLESGARVVGGDFEGGGYGGQGACFRFDPGTGQQDLERFQAMRGWRQPILRYIGNGGSQSRVSSFCLSCDKDRNQPFAVSMEPGGEATAAPRHFTSGEFNGAPSFDFDGCSIVLIDSVYCGPLHFTDSSRGVMISNTRVGNQPALEIRGNNHVLVGGWYPRLTLASGVDNCVVSGFFNSGYVRDRSGNGRNLIDYWEHDVPPAPSADERRLSTAGPSQAGIARSGSTYFFRFGIQLDMRQLGSGLLYLDLPDGVATSAGTDQWGTGMLQMLGQNQLEPLALRVLPAGERRAIAFYGSGRPLGGRPGIARLTGTVSFTA